MPGTYHNTPIPKTSLNVARHAVRKASVIGAFLAAFGITHAQANQTAGQKIVITTDAGQARATLLNNDTARLFASRLPLTIDVGPVFGRELYGPMEPIDAADADLTKTYKVGDIGYWPPSPGFAIYTRVAGPTISGRGVAILGSIDDNIEIFTDNTSTVTITLEQ